LIGGGTLPSLLGIAQFFGLKTLLSHPAVRERAKTWPFFRKLYQSGWNLTHPLDRFLGTDTSGYIAANKLSSGVSDSQHRYGYAGSQPSILRSALQALPPLDGYSFIDLGCGKGRPLLVASEFPFREIVGVEVSPRLADQAKKNAGILRRRFPERVPIRVLVCDASAYPFPPGNLVVFLYNPFGEEVIAKVIVAMEASLPADRRKLFVVYYNPVYGACFDASRAFSRYFAARLPYSKEEKGYGADFDDTVVIWQAGVAEPAHDSADARIVVINPSVRAEIA
jgi:SAM-dependent methyltransferase